MANVRLPGNLVALFPGTPRRLDLPGATVSEVLASLDARVPGMHDRLLTAGPEIREHIKVFVDGRQAQLVTPVGTASVVDVVPAVSGG
ncbi:MAG TPA: MoaD/ThiS family protein, partial [Candidatus Limnocylindrales bacterium]